MDILGSKVYVDKRSNDLVNAINFIFSNALNVSISLNDNLTIIIESSKARSTIYYNHELALPYKLTVNNKNGNCERWCDVSEHQDANSLISSLLIVYPSQEFIENWDNVKDFFVTL